MTHPLINISKQPTDDVISAYNCAKFCYEITDYITVVGDVSFVEIQVDNPISLGETMNLFGEQFLFTNNINDNGHNINIGIDEVEQRDLIYDTLLTNYKISKNFIFKKVSNDRLLITAKTKGTDFDIKFSSTSSDLQEISSSPGVDIEQMKTYKLVAAIQLYENSQWVIKDKLVRDVAIVNDSEGSPLAQVCYSIESFLSSYKKSKKPNLTNNIAYIDPNGSFEFKLGYVSFKSTTGQVGTSGFFDSGDRIYAVINGKHMPEGNMRPYYQKITDGYVLPLNQITSKSEMCCDNNSFLSLFVHDKDRKGWSVEALGTIKYEDGTSDFNRYGGYSGVGSAVVIIPIGPQQISICAKDKMVVSYNYQGFIFNNSDISNLFTDGDNGTFENSISGMFGATGIALSQTPDGFVGNGLLLSNIANANYTPAGTTVLSNITDIFFEKGNVYFIECWINVEGLNCQCLTNIFKDAHYGTFDGPNPMDFISVVNRASSDIATGYENQSLKIYDLDQSSLQDLDFLMKGDTNIQLPTDDFILSAWVKIINVDCNSCLYQPNLFTDGDNGTFENPPQLSGIVPLSGITASIGSGTGGSDGLQLSNMNSATISDGSILFRGDTSISFAKDETYIVTMDVRVEDFNCDLFLNLFTDGDNGTFEANINGMIFPVPNIIGSQSLGTGRTGGNSLLIENAVPIVLGINSVLTSGTTPITFEAGKTYELIGWIDLEGDALITACADPTGFSMGIRISDAISIGDITFVSQTNAVYNSTTCTTNPQWIEVRYRFTANNTISKNVGIRVISGPAFLQPAFQEIYFDDFRIEEIGATPKTINLSAGLVSGIGSNGTEIIDNDLLLDINCLNIDNWITVQTTINATSSFLGKIGLKINGEAQLFENINTIVRADNVTVLGPLQDTQLRMHASGLSSGSTQNYTKTLSIGYNCDNIGKWTKVETIISNGIVFSNINVGLQVSGNFSCIKNQNVELMIDNIMLTSINNQNVEFSLITSDGADLLSTLKIGCEKLEGWHKLVSSYTPTSDTNEVLALRVSNRVECIDSGSIIVDEIKVICRDDISASMTPEYNINIKNKENCCCEDCCNEEFAYINELGQYDFIHFECSSQEEIIISRTNFQICENCDEDISNIGSVTGQIEAKDRFLINSRVDYEKMNQLKIFMASIEVYHIVEGKYYPVNILTKELETFMINKNFIDLEIEFEYKFNNPTLIS